MTKFSAPVCLRKDVTPSKSVSPLDLFNKQLYSKNIVLKLLQQLFHYLKICILF